MTDDRKTFADRVGQSDDVMAQLAFEAKRACEAARQPTLYEGRMVIVIVAKDRAEPLGCELGAHFEVPSIGDRLVILARILRDEMQVASASDLKRIRAILGLRL